MGGLLTEPLREAIEHSPPTNASGHRPYREYYDDELRELVARKSRWLTERFRLRVLSFAHQAHLQAWITARRDPPSRGSPAPAVAI